MPKIIPISEKRKWLQFYEQGKSEASIAKVEQRDINVIKRGILAARNERDLSLARSEMLKDALRQHQDKLLEVMDNILNSLVMPPVDLEMPGKPADVAYPIKLSGARIEYDPEAGLVVMIQNESDVHWELIQEHLKHDRLWGKLTQWKAAMVTHMKARINLRLKAEVLLRENTGLGVIDTIDNAPNEDYLYPAAVNLFYQIATKKALKSPNKESFREALVVLSEAYIKYAQGNIPLVHCSKNHADYRIKIIDAFKKLNNASESSKINETYEALSEATDKARKMAEEITLLGLIPGQCRVCRRLGM